MTLSSLVRRSIQVEWYDEVRVPEQEWAVDQVLPLHGLAALYGESGAGKSFVALDWALRMSAGMPIMGARTERLGTAYIAAEGASGIRKRVIAWKKFHAVKGPQPFLLVGECLDLRAASSPDLDALIGRLRAARDGFYGAGAELGMVVVDTLASVTPGVAENSSEGMGGAIYAFRRLMEELGVLVLVVHHTGHSDTHRLRGWSGLPAAIDTSIEIAKKRHTRTIRLRKQKDGEDDRVLGAMRLERVAIGNGAEGQVSRTSAVVAYEDNLFDFPNDTPAALRPNEQRMFSAVQRALDEFGMEPPPGFLPADSNVLRCVARSKVIRQFLAADPASDDCVVTGSPTAAQRQEVSRALSSLVSRGLIAQYKVSTREAYIWLCGGP